jgi:hypothetical protein
MMQLIVEVVGLNGDDIHCDVHAGADFCSNQLEVNSIIYFDRDGNTIKAYWVVSGTPSCGIGYVPSERARIVPFGFLIGKYAQITEVVEHSTSDEDRQISVTAHGMCRAVLYCRRLSVARLSRPAAAPPAGEGLPNAAGASAGAPADGPVLPMIVQVVGMNNHRYRCALHAFCACRVKIDSALFFTAEDNHIIAVLVLSGRILCAVGHVAVNDHSLAGKYAQVTDVGHVVQPNHYLHGLPHMCRAVVHGRDMAVVHRHVAGPAQPLVNSAAAAAPETTAATAPSAVSAADTAHTADAPFVNAAASADADAEDSQAEGHGRDTEHCHDAERKKRPRH